MNVNQFIEDNGHLSSHTVLGKKPREKYGLFSFLFDLIMIGLTGGLWLIWIFCREMRKR